MAYYKTHGIVLRRMNLGEADRIITIFTRDNGKVRAVAKGVRRIKSRLAGHLEPFGSVELMFAVGRNLDVITSARLLRSGDGISAEADSLTYAYLFAEMLDRLVDEGVAQPELYDLVEDSFADLGQTGGDKLLELFFKLRLLEALGYRPQLSGCTICQSNDPETQYFFVSEIGGIVDATCSRDQRFPMSLNQIKLWRLMMTQPLPQVRRLAGAADLAKASLEVCNYFYDYTFGKQFTSNLMFE